eukprot:TRINITY_DN7813_c0_g1_i1.p1 TRINITY_DN7813_c0_g1~~TRINITY_DN7813_c0_g1_i1.p1  ORF type:complete len:180 (+),score=21.01 TRINITY_DN7813_c0_g1_i1:34-573(+)
MESEKIVRLNIGGYHYQTTQDTLTKEKPNFFSGLFSGKMTSITDSTGAYFIDRDGEYFKPLLGFLRCGELHIPSDLSIDKVYSEAQFYGIQLPSFTPEIETKVSSVQYHSFDNIDTFKNKLQFEISKLEKQGWVFKGSDVISGVSMNLGVDPSVDKDQITWFLYFERKKAIQKLVKNLK